MKIPWAKPTIFGNELECISEAIKSTFISDGAFLGKCEEKLSSIHHGKCLCVANGTVSLQLALQTLGISTGDEVLVPGWCFAAAPNMVLACDATPIYVDVTEDTWLMNPNEIEKHITKRTKAIIPVHTYGNLCDMPSIRKTANKYGLFVIEDCAESIFSKIDNKLCGEFSDIASYSFQATKTITCGEGGMVLINNNWVDKAILIRSHGLDRTSRNYYWHHLLGYNYRLTNIQAAMLFAQLQHVDEIIDKRMSIYNRYEKNLSGKCQLQLIRDNVKPVIWTIGVRINGNRNQIMDKLRNEGIETRSGFCAFSEQPLYNTPPLQIASRISKEIMCLPFFYDITNDQIDFICEKL
jgi:perosamine synthetase